MLKLICKLPLPTLLWFGRRLGALAFLLIKKRRQITIDNLKLAFPTHTDTMIKQLARANFKNLGMGFMEAIYAWHADKEKLQRLARIEGLENLAQDKGVILMFAHFASLEIGGVLLSMHIPMCAMYKEQSSLFFNKIMKQGRVRFAEAGHHLVSKDDVRDLIRVLRDKKKIFYAADQHSTKGSWTFATFFNQQVATTIATSRIVKKTAAQIVFINTRRKNGLYHIKIHQPLKNFGDNPVADAQKMMSFVEEEARAQPEQYFWVHRRFKPPPADSYARLVKG